jgi:hypothetical protein
LPRHSPAPQGRRRVPLPNSISSLPL